MRTAFARPLPHAGGMENLVHLDRDHPGFRDRGYRARRDAIAQIALDYRAGDPVPDVAYTDEEHAVWRTVRGHLAPLHERYACREYLAGARELPLDADRVPQFSDVNRALSAATGFTLAPVAGLVSAATFLEYLGRRQFLSTQYMRHHSTPLYTPEPDVVHEIVGHAVSLVRPAFADLNARFGEVASTVTAPADIERIVRAYWYTIEFGAVVEGGDLKVYGAGLLSSFGELGRFETNARHVPLDVNLASRTPYDPTNYQATVFVAEGFDALSDALCRWLDGF